MKQNSEQIRGGVPLIMVEGRKLLRRSARKAGETATRYARKGRRIVGRTLQRTQKYARRKPWTSMGAVVCTSLFFGFLSTVLFFRKRW